MDDQKPVITPKPNGSLLVKGLKQFVNSKGEELETKETVSLCRCGASENKPFCDGSHRKIGFSDENEGGVARNLNKEYKGAKISIYDNRRICSHAKNCVNNLATVFDFNKRPWINPDGDTVENIIKVIETCPSGALSYKLEDEIITEFGQNPRILIDKNGPYYVQGGIVLEKGLEMEGMSKEHYVLCRCGASKNKPYCDGSHIEVDFQDPDN